MDGTSIDLERMLDVDRHNKLTETCNSECFLAI